MENKVAELVMILSWVANFVHFENVAHFATKIQAAGDSSQLPIHMKFQKKAGAGDR